MTVDHYEGGFEIPDFDPTREHFYIGQRFYTKKEASLAVKHWALHNNRALTTSRSKTWELEVRCYSYKTNNCPWRLRVTSRADDGFWTVRQWNPHHTCDGSEHNVESTQLDVNVIVDAVMHLVRSRPHFRIRLIQDEISHLFQRQISYRKAWYGKQRAMEMTYGNWEESYNKLQDFFNEVQSRNPGTQVQFRFDDLIGGVGVRRQFRSVFWSFRPCIEGFRHCPPVLVVDGTFLTEKYSGTLLMASSFDGNHNILTDDFAIVDKESIDTWVWFLHCIQELVTDRQNIGAISDRHAGLRAAMDQIGGGWVWRWCSRHYESNYNSHVKDPNMKARLKSIGKLSLTTAAFSKFHWRFAETVCYSP